MCIHNHEEEENRTRYGWVCDRCNMSISPDSELCPVCNDFGEENEEDTLQHNTERQDNILNNNQLFERLIGN